MRLQTPGNGSCATVLDSDSDGASTILENSDADTLIIISDDEPDEASNLETVDVFWSRRASRFPAIWKASQKDTAIVWELSRPQFADDQLEQHSHSQRVIRAYLQQGYIRNFKIGLTTDPVRRFRNREFGYCTLGYHTMVILSVHDDAQRIADLETSLLQVFRRYDRQGRCVNPDGHPLCRNRAPGGENAFGGIAPFFCYLALQRSDQHPH